METVSSFRELFAWGQYHTKFHDLNEDGEIASVIRAEAILVDKVGEGAILTRGVEVDRELFYPGLYIPT